MLYFRNKKLSKVRQFAFLLFLDNTNTTKPEVESKKLLNLRNALKNIDIVIILIQNFILFFIVSQADLVINMVTVINFQWSLTRLSIVTIIAMVTSVILMTVMEKKLKCGINTYFLFVCSLIESWVLLIFLLIPTNIMVTNIFQQTSVIFLALLFNIMLGYSVCAWSLMLLFFVVPEHSRSFVSGIRHGVMKFSNMIGYLLAAFAYSHSVFLYPALICCCFSLTVYLLVRRTTFFTKYNVHE